MVSAGTGQLISPSKAWFPDTEGKVGLLKNDQSYVFHVLLKGPGSLTGEFCMTT
jgi:hypothetical protein